MSRWLRGVDGDGRPRRRRSPSDLPPSDWEEPQYQRHFRGMTLRSVLDPTVAASLQRPLPLSTSSPPQTVGCRTLTTMSRMKTGIQDCCALCWADPSGRLASTATQIGNNCQPHTAGIRAVTSALGRTSAFERPPSGMEQPAWAQRMRDAALREFLAGSVRDWQNYSPVGNIGDTWCLEE